jgi:hypothetical protein
MPDPLQTSQQRWEQFFAQQGRQMPQAGRPTPPAAAPAAPPMAQQQGQRTSFFGNIFKQLMTARRAQQATPPAQAATQGTQQFGAAMPFQTGGGSFFRRRGV